MIEENKAKLALISILDRAIAIIRGNASDLNVVSCEANHVHNIPQMLRQFDINLLRYYIEVERAEYVNIAPVNFSNAHQADWKVLFDFLEISCHDKLPGKPGM